MSRLVIVSDIWGQTPALKKLASSLSDSALVVDPYDGIEKAFASESLAYEAFLETGGVEHYAKHLEQVLSTQLEPLTVVAFSAGATAAWLNSNHESTKHVQKIWCFYGSQIRHHLSVQPSVPVMFLLPASEPGFDVQIFHTALADRPNVSMHQTNYAHGFMNRCSPNFHEQAYQETMERLKLDLVNS